MFSGLIEDVGQVVGREEIPNGIRLGVETVLGLELSLGDSIAVNGACLTVVSKQTRVFRAEISPETARVTTLGDLRPGDPVNLERPLRVDGRFGGHFVLGHVDGVGRIRAVERQADFSLVTVEFDPGLSPYVVSKGSIALDGISLTVATLGEETFDVQIIPFTWEHTNLHASKVGSRVNLECDIIGKHVVRALSERR